MNLNSINTSNSLDALANVKKVPHATNALSDFSQIQISNKNLSIKDLGSIQQEQGKTLKDTKENDKGNNTLQPTIEETDEMVEDLNDYMNGLKTSLRFSISEDIDRQVIVKIKNRETDEVIKQIPAEELINIKKKMEELTGMLLDHSV